MKEIYPDIFQITINGFLGRLRPEVNVFIIAGPDGMVFDAGFGTRRVGRFIVSEIKKIETIYRERGKEFKLDRVMTSHSHGDHYPGMVYLRKKLGLQIIVTEEIDRSISHRKNYRKKYERHQSDQWYTAHGPIMALLNNWGVLVGRAFFHLLFGFRFIDNPDIILSHDETVSINGRNWEIISAPGHAFDHIHLYNREDGLLFAGDNVLRGITPWLGPPESDLKAYIMTLESLYNMKGLKILFCGHGSPVLEPYDRVRSLIQYRKERITEIYKIVSESGSHGISFNEIINKVYIKESGFKKSMGRGWIAVTLKYLEQEGRITWEYSGREIRIHGV